MTTVINANEIDRKFDLMIMQMLHMIINVEDSNDEDSGKFLMITIMSKIVTHKEPSLDLWIDPFIPHSFKGEKKLPLMKHKIQYKMISLLVM